MLRWLADWRSRPDVQPWMLYNLCVALRHQGRYEQAHEVARHVVDTWAHRERAADLRLFLAVEEALRGSLPEATEHLRHVQIRAAVAHDQDLLAVEKAGPGTISGKGAIHHCENARMDILLDHQQVNQCIVDN